ncbi:unnamed protein product (macronuclear) [Paramecium tetraurelia]|uniref:CBM20 domain-containing protein n=1 Tax=Paramecium tetraurelia TaxID=5888 RepID=A0CB80_PARTE|nr:uncharacterized protein GSPATT00036830001 [Paramecium tetraurelia]CAK68047.1 unnamed protein product [Paramecium tetraurelia]|eukprot:XP_001435444.1 hypothetical protein (macronuclear) [Paramecium tetraurelia strain d4-2]
MSYISFKVTKETKYSQIVRICGNHPLLGQWNPHDSYLLCTSSDTYPEWTQESKIQIDPSFILEFKCLIQDGDNYIWENIPNRIHKCDFRRNFLYIKFDDPQMNIRTFQKYEISHEFVQEELIQKMNRSRDYNPFDMAIDSSDNESIPEYAKEVRGPTSIRQLEIDWRDLIKSHFESKQKLKSISKFRKISEQYGSPDLIFDYKRKRSNSTQILIDSYVICLSLKIPIKITLIDQFHQVKNKQDITNKYKFELTSDPYYANMYNLFSNRLSLKAIWIGWMGIQVQDENEYILIQQHVYEQYKCFGIQIDEDLLECFPQLISPIFNNLTPQLRLHSEDDYMEINKIFAKYVQEALNCTLFQNQFCHLHSIFIFDYHLYLIPIYIKEGLIRKNESRPRICIIMRRSFPNPKQFRILSCSETILSSILMSDLISLIQLKDLYQFVHCLPQKYQKLTQVQGVSAFTIEVLGRKIILDYGSVGLNIRQLQNLITADEPVQEEQFTLLGVDSLSLLSGLQQKFKIVEQMHLLKQYRIQLIQILYTNNDEEYQSNCQIQKYLEEIKTIAKQINQKYQQELIQIKLDLSQSELISLYGKTDIFIKTPLRESISSNYLEYIYIRQSRKKSAKLVLSQWCSLKVDHKKINPNNTIESAQAILNYLNDKKPTFINVPSSNDWLLRLNDHLSYCEDSWLDKQLYDSAKELTIGLKDKHFCSIETTNIVSKFSNSNHQDNQRIIILAYTKRFVQKIQNLDQLVQALEKLAQDENNTLIIVSDQESEVLELNFGSINNLYMIAQDGLFIKQNNLTSFQQIIEKDDQIEGKLQQLSLMEHLNLTEKNQIYTLSLKEKVKDTNAAANVFFSNLIKELKIEFDDYLVFQENYTIQIKHQYQQIEELLRMIIINETNQKGLVSFANIISFDRGWLEKIMLIFQSANMPLNKVLQFILHRNFIVSLFQIKLKRIAIQSQNLHKKLQNCQIDMFWKVKIKK